MYFYMIAGSWQQRCRQPSATLSAAVSNIVGSRQQHCWQLPAIIQTNILRRKKAHLSIDK